jgi:hypothetical protein
MSARGYQHGEVLVGFDFGVYAVFRVQHLAVDDLDIVVHVRGHFVGEHLLDGGAVGKYVPVP